PDAARAGRGPSPPLELGGELGPLDLAPEHDHAVLCVHDDRALRQPGVSEDLALDLLLERRVVRLRLRPLAQMQRLLLEPVRLGASAPRLVAERAPSPADEVGRAIAELVPAVH